MKEPLVVIVILNWNGWRDTINCLRSLRNITYKNHHIILIDNGSTDDSTHEIIPHLNSNIYFQNNKTNVGFAKASNQGIRYAIDMGAEWILLLNNDTIVDPNFLTEMMYGAARSKNVGMIQPLMLRLNEPNTIDSTGHVISWGQVYDRGANKPKGKYYSDGLIGCSGAAGLYRVEMIKQIGLLDESYDSGYEDSEYSWRAYKANWRTAYDPDAIVYHKRGISMSERTFTDESFARKLWRDAARPCKTHGTPIQKWQLIIHTVVTGIRSEIGYHLCRNTYGCKPQICLIVEMLK